MIVNWSFILTALAISFLALSSAQNVTDDKENILDWEVPPEITRRFPIYHTGYDKEGFPVFLMEAGKWDIRGFIESPNGPKLFKKFSEYFAKLLTTPSRIEPLVAGDPRPEKGILIANMDNYNIRQVAHGETLQAYLYAMRKLVEGIRDTRNTSIKKGFFINSNFVFLSVWNLMKPIFGETISFMELFSTKANKWRPALLEYIDRDQLPEHLGGPKTHQHIKLYG